ncbi:TetR/AcrR family transcriptional regulator [uncultured Clostridium sp.]|uniref:TetR/AcrR family transcriptional regulator n=1 Tax=uncultured Clostridium sp. TaxID=59620 RepID=UPI0025E3A85D|nr:TetR/AcrR family transcriptional regulator [uncultured Clostridium sp.]
MGRRKKEPGSVHREAIASAAGALFAGKGIEATSMDEIAEKSGYSKATLYVYFKNKEEIAGILALESMQKLHGCINSALRKEKSTRRRYDLICRALQQYQEEFPFYFKMALDTINIDFDGRDFLPEELETYRVGELLNEELKEFINDGIREGELREEIEVMATIFSFWGMLSGLIQTAANKEAYISRNLQLSKQEFLDYGYDTLYRSILKTG